MSKSKKNVLWLAAAATLVFSLILSACQPAQPTAEPTSVPPTETVEPGAPTTQPTPTLYVLTGAQTTSTGLQYLEETAGKGETPKKGEIVTMNYIVTLTDGTELANTYTQQQPVSTVYGDNRLLPGWEEGVGLMKAGGKSKLVLPASLAFGEQGSGAIPPNAQVVMEVELVSIKAAPVPTTVDAKKLTTTESGLQYYDITPGTGTEAVKNATVTTNYTVWVKTETGFNYIDESDSSSGATFVIGRGDTVFPGWEEGATGMKVGGKRLLVIPPALALGAQGSSLIPPDSTLVMEITMSDVKEPRFATKVEEKDFKTTESGLKYYDLKEGTGETPQAGQTVVVHYTGWLTDGSMFDSSVDSGQPFSFKLGSGGVIKGWDEGLSTMKVGGKRQLVIPPELGYGEQGAGAAIPPGATLVFEVELLEIQK